MLEDRYGNAISSASPEARDAYVEGVDRFLAAQAQAEEPFDRAIAADPDFALAHVGLARLRQAMGQGKDTTGPLAAARALAPRVAAREQYHIEALGLLVEGAGPAAYAAIRAHLLEYPRDAMVAQTCMGVFGLIGFSGQPGRESEQLAFTSALAPHYGDDWWFLGQHAFAQIEAGQIDPAVATIERSMSANPANAHGAHVRAHVHYESGESAAGYDAIRSWREGYDKSGQLHCHVSWHVALWALESGDTQTMWHLLDADVAPGGAWGPPINVLTDTAALLHRAELAGVDVPGSRWRALSEYAARVFPEPGVAFADVHAALAHAMAGAAEPLSRIITDARGPAADLVRRLAEAFQAIAAGEWAQATAHLAGAMADHERIGGSRAQRDLLEYALLGALLRQGRADEARLVGAMRRPRRAGSAPVKGF